MHPTTLTLVAAATLSASALPAAAEVLLDYRDEAFLSGSPFYAASERRAVADALRKAPGELAKRFPEDFALRGDASGSFTGQD